MVYAGQSDEQPAQWKKRMKNNHQKTISECLKLSQNALESIWTLIWLHDYDLLLFVHTYWICCMKCSVHSILTALLFFSIILRAAAAVNAAPLGVLCVVPQTRGLVPFNGVSLSGSRLLTAVSLNPFSTAQRRYLTLTTLHFGRESQDFEKHCVEHLHCYNN